jgi:hypothetical protein
MNLKKELIRLLKKNNNLYYLTKIIREIYFYLDWNKRRFLNYESKYNRMMVVYDTSRQPYSIGDFIDVMQASLVLAKLNGIKKIDCSILYDRLNPSKSDSVFDGVVNYDNIYEFLNILLPIVQLNQLIGSIHIFDNNSLFLNHISGVREKNLIWPDTYLLESGKYLTPIIYREILFNYYNEYLNLPILSGSDYLNNWANNFFNQFCGNKTAVTVNIRNNNLWSHSRNSKIDQWVLFFKYCATRHNVLFFIICSKDEIDENLRSCTNVIIVKDYSTNIVQDLSLILNSKIHLGANSGPSTLAWYSGKPVLTVNIDLNNIYFCNKAGMVKDLGDGFQALYFFDQKIHHISYSKTFIHIWIIFYC